jgi:PiT family inorganic phosphate transporter
MFSQIPSTSVGIFLVLALGMALAFEFVNGFHDTANAVATVIYTHTLRPYVAVVWSGMWNLIGVLTSTGAVAFSIVALLPTELVLNVGSGPGFAMIFSLLISAMIWNLGTWYLGLPASSSHTLIGAIVGVGLANAVMAGRPFGEGVNWGKVGDVGMSLLVSPIVGFVCAALLLLLAKALIRIPSLYEAPEKDQPPPFWIRSLLVLTCTGVSFAHGSNDGQKGMGLLVLILIGILPASYALKMDATPDAIHHVAADSTAAAASFDKLAQGASSEAKDSEMVLQNYLKSGNKMNGQNGTTFAALAQKSREITAMLTPIKSYNDLDVSGRRATRKDLYMVAACAGKLVKSGEIKDPAAAASLKKYAGELDKSTQFIPLWVKVAVACALGFGTMVGWKRIVVTVGEKIGKTHLTYAQGACAELVAMATIGAADWFGLPVSTTHVLSSGVAGTMAANHSGLQMATLRNLILAWVLTLPVCIFLGATFFSGALYVLFHVVGVS